VTGWARVKVTGWVKETAMGWVRAKVMGWVMAMAKVMAKESVRVQRRHWPPGSPPSEVLILQAIFVFSLSVSSFQGRTNFP